MSRFVSVLAFSLIASGISEAISYALVYRTDQFQHLKQKIVQNELKLEEEKQVVGGSGSGKHRQRRIESLEAMLSAARSKAGGLQLRSTIMVGVMQLLFIYVVNLVFRGQIVATLPFEPLSMFRSLTHRGLPEDSPSNACSATFVFVLGGLVFKSMLDRCLQLGLPKGSSLPKWVTNPEDVIAGK
ncbi:Calcium load-activated calcium channel [Coemansia sp. RSA 1939]|nr:Calcium load-activated calcium channel [Coemansia sp. RSA 1939]